jgi:hypothetical protein
MRSISEVIASPVVGNAYSDHNLWQETYAYALARSVPLADRAAAIRKMDEITGCNESEGRDDETLVKEFVEGIFRDCGVSEVEFPETYLAKWGN